jgi:6-phosphofructokinase 1
MKVAIMTGGGDSPGMNAFIRAVVRCCLNLRPATSVWGVIDGWRGLVDGNFKKLTKKDTAGIAHQGGTILGTLRVPELKDDRDMQEAIALNLHDNFFDYLFIIGGNGSLAASNVINNIIKEKGLRTKLLVTAGSIDNDVCNNYGYSIGFYSAIDKSLEMLEWIRDTASAHRRVYIIESMGRDSGDLAVFAWVATGAEHKILPNDEVDYEQLVNLISERDRDTRIIVAEGYPKTADEIRKILEEIFARRNIKHEIRHVDMGYFQRGGKAAVKDIIVASWLGYVMVKDAFEGVDSGFYICFHPGENPVRLPLDVAADQSKTTHLDIPQHLKEFEAALR